jgi:hypothetical protein
VRAMTAVPWAPGAAATRPGSPLWINAVSKRKGVTSRAGFRGVGVPVTIEP